MKHLTFILNKCFPIPEDISSENLYKVHMLYVVVNLFCAMIPLLFVYSFIAPPALVGTFRVTLLFLFMLKIPILLSLRKRKWGQVALILIICLWSVITYGTYIGGIYASVTLLYVIPLNLSVFFLKKRFSAFLTILTILYVILMMILEANLVISVYFEKTLLFQAIILMIIFLTTSGLLAFNNHTLRKIAKKNQQLYLEQEISKIQSLYSQNLSHDLRTPITVLTTQIYLIKKRMEHGLSIDDNIEKLTLYTQNLMKIVDNFTQISEFMGENGVTQSNWQAVKIDNSIVSAITESNLHNKQKNISIILNCDADTDYITYGNEDYLQRMFKSLLHNAIDYGRQDGEVTISISKTEKEILIEFKDNGIGISQENIDKIFDLFYRANEARTMDAHTGSGVGLALTQHIIKLHKGYIEVSSELDTGSTFIIHLPIKLNR